MTTSFRRLRQTLMAGAGRQDDDVARHDFDLLAVLAAEAHRGAAAGDAHRLVDHRMIVHIGINAVAPHIAPAVGGEGFLDHVFRIGRAGEVDAAAVKHERQARIVRNAAIVGEYVGDGSGPFHCTWHSSSSRTAAAGSTGFWLKFLTAMPDAVSPAQAAFDSRIIPTNRSNNNGCRAGRARLPDDIAPRTPAGP